MGPNIEKYVSNFIEQQFPQFYREEGPNFIIFMQAYYEWLESTGQPIREARSLFEYRDIDTTPEKFLEFFQKKYLYGIPFRIISNKRFILKHILDVYRSKGSIQCYRLLFKLIYDEDVEIYLPGVDIVRVSEGTWVEPRYIEVTDYEGLDLFVGKTIMGYSSGTSAIVESITRESYNQEIFNIVYLSNVYPKGGDFIIGEKVGPADQKFNSSFISVSPKVLGSLDNIDVTFGGRGFKVGDTLQIVGKDKAAEYISEKVPGDGSLNFELIFGGGGFSKNSNTFVYKTTSSGNGASFQIGSIADSTSVSYNTDIVGDYIETFLGTTIAFPRNSNSTINSIIGETLTYQSDAFGRILSLANTVPGKGYKKPTDNFVRSTFTGKRLSGTVTYNSASKIVNYNTDEPISRYVQMKLNRPVFNAAKFSRNPTANVYSKLDNTIKLNNFTQAFSNGDVIVLQAIDGVANTQEFAMVKEVLSSSRIRLYGNPTSNSTKTAFCRTAPSVFPSNFGVDDPLMERADGTVNGLNEKILTTPNSREYIRFGALTDGANTRPYGKEGILVVTEVGEGGGTLDFELINGGYGYTVDSDTFVYRVNGNGQNASFKVGSIADVRVIEYNTDIISDYLENIINSSSYNFPALPAGAMNTPIQACLTYTTDSFGTITSLSNTVPGAAYNRPTNNFVRTTIKAKPLSGTVQYNTGTNVVRYTSSETISQFASTRLNLPFNFTRNPVASIYSKLESTIKLSNFTQVFSNGDVIVLQAVANQVSTQELAVIKEVVSQNKIILYGYPKSNSTLTSFCRTAPTVFPANYALTEEYMQNENGTINGENAEITSSPNIGSNVVKAVKGFSGKGYLPNERVEAFVIGQIDPTVRIINGGRNYANTDKIVFIDNAASRVANGYITTNPNGTIVSVTMTNLGSGYLDPIVRLKSNTGSGAILSAFITSGQIDPTVKIEENFLCAISDPDYSKYAKIAGKLNKKGSGIQKGYWTTTRSFLNSDKYIQDSYYYQDYSYEVRVAQTLDKYKNILYETFHPAASEIFGKYYLARSDESKAEVLYATTQPVFSVYVPPPPPVAPPDPCLISP